MARRLVRTFKLKPEPDREEYYRVLIFRTRDQMHEFWKHQVDRMPLAERRQHDNRNLNFEGQATWWGRHRPDRGRQVGQVIFHFARCGPEIVSHEMTHAAVYWMHGRNLKIDQRKNDEPFASVVGRLTGKFYRKFWQLFPKQRWR